MDASKYYFTRIISYSPTLSPRSSDDPRKAASVLGRNLQSCQSTFPIFLATHIISGMGKATDFKFGRYIHRVHPKKSPFLDKGSMGVSRDFPILGVRPIISGTGNPLLQERVKLRTSNFVRTFIGSIETKAHEEFWKK